MDRLIDTLREVVDDDRRSVAIVSDQYELSYNSLLESVGNCAARLQKHYPQAGPVGICMNMSPEYVVTMFTCLSLGRTFVPLNPNHPPDRLSAIAAQTGCTSVFFASLETPPPAWATTRGVLNLRRHDGQFVLECMDGVGSETLESTETDKARAMYILPTSGSTGTPKAILGSEKGVDHFIKWEIGQFGLGRETRGSALSAPTFDVSLRDILVPILAGGTLCIPGEDVRYSPAQLLQWLRNQRISLSHIVPTVFRLLIRARQVSHSSVDLPHLKNILLAGESLYWEDITSWRQIGGCEAQLINVYGPSETTLAKFFYPIPERCGPAGETVPLGKPIPDTSVTIAEPEAKGEGPGEIVIETDFGSFGYLNNEELNTKAFQRDSENPTKVRYRTGDLGTLDPDGNLCFRGRFDDQVKFHGNRIELGEIEVVLRRASWVCEAAAAIKGPANLRRIIGYVVLSATHDDSGTEKLKSLLKESLPDYMQPSQLLILESIPKTHSGKIDRNALPLPPKRRIVESANFSPPSMESERKLALLWSEVLNVEPVGLDDNFFDLGGSSLLAAQLAIEAQRHFGVEVPLVSLFANPTVRLMARQLAPGASETPQSRSIEDRAAKRRQSRSITRAKRGSQ